MAESTRLVDLVQQRIDGFLDDQETDLAAIADELTELTALARSFLAGGKRFRALFCYWGWQAATGLPDGFDPLPEHRFGDDLPGIVSACAALEVFHAAALVHDDIMDASDTRRGAPSAHRRLEARHSAAGWQGDAARFGTSSALLLGDLLLGWSDELFDAGTALLRDRALGRAGRAEFTRMRTEVTAGQYLDILEESAWASYPDSSALSRAHRVIVYKSAKYSIEAPLAIGAALGGATDQQLATLRAFGLPLGVAFQLRDDVLGVFGDPAVTGKPAGDDVREGKRTVLIALARARLSPSARAVLDELVGDPHLDDLQIGMVRSALVDCGALDEVESVIQHNVTVALDALRDAPLARAAVVQLRELAATVSRRSA